jgi:hypothetical protein
MFMYWLFINKNITPSQYYEMSLGEKIVLRGFVNRYIKDLKEKR